MLTVSLERDDHWPLNIYICWPSGSFDGVFYRNRPAYKICSRTNGSQT